MLAKKKSHFWMINLPRHISLQNRIVSQTKTSWKVAPILKHWAQPVTLLCLEGFWTLALGSEALLLSTLIPAKLASLRTGFFCKKDNF